MLNVVNDELVVEEKGIYSIEKFLIARRLMYWQVYLHKTVISLENTLIKILKRAKELRLNNKKIFITKSLKFFLEENISLNNFIKGKVSIDAFAKLDDHDIYSCLKEWSEHKDFILSSLSKRILERKPLKIITQNKKFNDNELKNLKKQVQKKLNISEKEVNY